MRICITSNIYRRRVLAPHRVATRQSGAPNPALLPHMTREHCDEIDSHDTIFASNYKTTTTPEIEWLFVTNGRKNHPEANAPSC